MQGDPQRLRYRSEVTGSFPFAKKANDAVHPLKHSALHWSAVRQVLMPYTARRQPFQPNDFLPGMNAETIARVVGNSGKRIGIERLSAHDRRLHRRDWQRRAGSAPDSGAAGIVMRLAAGRRAGAKRHLQPGRRLPDDRNAVHSERPNGHDQRQRLRNTISGDDSYRILKVTKLLNQPRPTLTIRNLTLDNGKADRGGAVGANNAQLTATATACAAMAALPF